MAWKLPERAGSGILGTKAEAVLGPPYRGADRARRPGRGNAMPERHALTREFAQTITALEDSASEMNLRLLNAAIEAARAFPHGQGFADVAPKVSQLAARMEEAAAEIAGLIQNHS